MKLGKTGSMTLRPTAMPTMPTSSVARARAGKSSSLVRTMKPCMKCSTRSVYGTNEASDAAAADPIADCST
jgi:hypothetical protein